MQLNNDLTVKNFLEKLLNDGKSKVSVKNYKSDLSHFLSWSILKLKSFGSYAENILEIIPFINKDFFNEYKSYMAENKIKAKTINRRLSTLRSFSRFLVSINALDQDFTDGIQNVGLKESSAVRLKDADIVSRFRESLTSDKKVSDNTIKNYVSDVKSFLNWTNRKGELPNGV